MDCAAGACCARHPQSGIADGAAQFKNTFGVDELDELRKKASDGGADDGNFVAFCVAFHFGDNGVTPGQDGVNIFFDFGRINYFHRDSQLIVSPGFITWISSPAISSVSLRSASGVPVSWGNVA